MTALVVVTDKPLARDQLGPDLIMTDQDVATYSADAADQQSVVPVTLGEHLNEFEALEAMLIPSGNNIAETLARWDAGTVPAFVTKMNQRAMALHLEHTTFADPAGVSIQTVSTPTDLMALGMAAFKQDVIAEIVSLPQTTLPVAEDWLRIGHRRRLPVCGRSGRRRPQVDRLRLRDGAADAGHSVQRSRGADRRNGTGRKGTSPGHAGRCGGSVPDRLGKSIQHRGDRRRVLCRVAGDDPARAAQLNQGLPW